MRDLEKRSPVVAALGPDQRDYMGALMLEAQGFFTELLGGGDLTDEVIERWFAEATSMAESEYRKWPFGRAKGIACKKGCSACCSQDTLVCPLELLLVDSRLRKAGLPESQAQRILEREAAARSCRTSRERVERQRPCPLLSDVGSCELYESRPFSCRANTSVDPLACGPPFTAALRQELASQVIFPLLQTATTQVLLHLGYDGRPVELTRGLGLLLRDSTARRRWLGKEQALEAAIPAEYARQMRPLTRYRSFRLRIVQ